MQVAFEFNQQLVPQSLIEIEEIGNFALEANNEDGYNYYLIVKTSLGNALLASVGPVVPDFLDIPNGFQINIEIMQYKEDKLIRFIKQFLNDRSKKLVSAQLVDVDTALEQFRDVKDFISNYQGDI